MNITTLRGFYVAVALYGTLILATSGCQSIGSGSSLLHCSDQSIGRGVVHSLGPILETRDIPLESERLVLVDAVDATLRDSFTTILTDESPKYLVSLTRGANKTIIPLPMIQLTRMGTISLRDGDLIQVIPWSESILAHKESASGQIVVGGFIQKQSTRRNILTPEKRDISGKQVLSSFTAVQEINNSTVLDNPPAKTGAETPIASFDNSIPAPEAPDDASKDSGNINADTSNVANPEVPGDVSEKDRRKTEDKPSTPKPFPGKDGAYIFGWTNGEEGVAYPDVCIITQTVGSVSVDYILPIASSANRESAKPLDEVITNGGEVLLQPGLKYTFYQSDLLPPVLASAIESSLHGELEQITNKCLTQNQSVNRSSGRQRSTRLLNMIHNLPGVGPAGQALQKQAIDSHRRAQALTQQTLLNPERNPLTQSIRRLEDR